jgi:hypothetical protein
MSHRLLQTPPHELSAIKGASMMAHLPEKEQAVLLGRLSQAAASIPAWPSYTGISQLVGTTPSGKVTVYVDPTLGAPALANAQGLIANGDGIVAKNDAIFGTAGGMANVILFALGGLTNGQGGADHMACNFTEGQNIEVCVDFGQPISGLAHRPPAAARVLALFEAELSECSMNNALCGQSTGEALSRWCAIQCAGNVLLDFETAELWLNFPVDYINVEDPTDRSSKATGCGMVFLSWLQSKNLGGLGIPLSTIAPKMVSLGNSGTFAQLYAELTGKPAPDALPDLMAAIAAAGGKFTLATSGRGDDPFNALNAPISGGGGGGGVPVNIVGVLLSAVVPKVGSPITATDGSWTNNPTSFTFQWKSGSLAISGATQATYIPVVADIGKNLTVSVVAINAAGAGVPATSSKTAPVVA